MKDWLIEWPDWDRMAGGGPERWLEVGKGELVEKLKKVVIAKRPVEDPRSMWQVAV